MLYLKKKFKNRLIFTRRSIFCFAVLLFIAGTSLSQINHDVLSRTISPGVEYYHQRISDGPLSIHWVKIDLSRSEIEFTTSLAKNTIYDLEPLSLQIQALDPQLGKPLVAVNGDFFRIRTGPFRGDPLGLQIVRGEIVSSPKNACFWISTKGKPRIDYIKPSFQAAWPDDKSVNFQINQECLDDTAVLYTPTMGSATRTTNALELILKKNRDSKQDPIKPGQTFNARIVSVNSKANSPIEKDKLVLAIGSALAKKFNNIAPDTVLSLSLKTNPSLAGVQTAIGGGPVLVRDAKVREFSGYQPRHPRTAIGFNNKYLFLLVVDGRQEKLSIGMTLPQLAKFMHQLGCTQAMNLDGGGSSTFWLDGKIMNSPSDKKQRSIANGLILLQKKKLSE